LTVFAVAKDAVASSVVLSAWYSALNASNATLDRWTSNVVLRTLDDVRKTSPIAGTRWRTSMPAMCTQRC